MESADDMEWQWRDQIVRLGLTRMGAGPTILLLPALSSISTREEMRPLQELLAHDHTTISVDWPGFGDAPKPFVDWRPDAYRAFLDYLSDPCRAAAIGDDRGRPCGGLCAAAGGGARRDPRARSA